MSAILFQLPTCPAAPIARQRPCQTLPAGVKSIQAHRLERQRRHDALVAFNHEHLRKNALDLLSRVLRGEVTGLSIIETREDKRTHIYAAGALANNLPLLRDELIGAMRTVEQWVIEDANRGRKAD